MNVLYITVDALRVDHVTEDVMPFTRSFVDESLEFTECIANGPGTPWSFPALLASRYAGSTDGFGIPGPDDPHPTLAEVLSQEGFDTGGFTDNRFASSAYNYDRGIDDMQDSGATSRLKGIKQVIRKNLDHDGAIFQTLLRTYHLVDDVFVRTSGKDSRYVRSESFVNDILDWTDTRDDWFAWFHPMDVHAPYEAPLEYQRIFLDEPVNRVRSQKLARCAVHHPTELDPAEWELQQKLYKAECRYLDRQLARLFDILSNRGALAETIVVFTADHGDMHGEHGRGGHPKEFWEEVVRVPLAISGPEIESATIDDQVCLVDIPPTILSLLGLKTPANWEGRPTATPADQEQLPREHAFIDVGAGLDRRHAGLRRADGWKLLRHQRNEYLFNLSENPDEDENRIGESTDVYKSLSETLDDHLDEMEHQRTHGETGIQDREMIEDHLKELGYLE